MHYRRIMKNDRHGWDIAYTYSARSPPAEGETEVWHREVAENQLVLVSAGDSFIRNVVRPMAGSSGQPAHGSRKSSNMCSMR